MDTYYLPHIFNLYYIKYKIQRFLNKLSKYDDNLLLKLYLYMALNNKYLVLEYIQMQILQIYIHFLYNKLNILLILHKSYIIYRNNIEQYHYIQIYHSPEYIFRHFFLFLIHLNNRYIRYLMYQSTFYNSYDNKYSFRLFHYILVYKDI